MQPGLGLGAGGHVGKFSGAKFPIHTTLMIFETTCAKVHQQPPPQEASQVSLEKSQF